MTGASSNVGDPFCPGEESALALLDRLFPEFGEDQKAERTTLLGLMAMFFLVVTAVGVLKPVKNALALDGTSGNDFYQVYLVSAVVVLFVPLYNRLADRIGWQRLVPAVALFFTANLVLFRLLYVDGSRTLGLLFYGWYDLFAAALVTQFFVATQMFLTARSARSAYPLVIGGGAIGAMLGGGIGMVLAPRIGAENLLWVAAGLIFAFAAGIPRIWPEEDIRRFEAEQAKRLRSRESISAGDLRRVFGNPHVRLIAVSVVLTILVKQVVDYQFNIWTEQRYVTRDAITAFQARINLYTQWLPLVSVFALRPILRRWGLGVAVFILPVLMLATSFAMTIPALFSIWAVIVVRTADTTFRYSAERAGREILYVPVPADIKLKAKTYIDVGIEKGLGKVLSAVLLFVLVELLGMTLYQLAFVVVFMAAAWLAVTVAIRREYVRTLARSIRGRWASFQGLSTLSDASTQKVVRRALGGEDTVQTSFALDLVDQSAGTDTRPIADALHDLLDHESQDIRRKALAILTSDPESLDVERVRPRLLDPARAVREQAVLALVAAAKDRRSLVQELLGSRHAQVRTATLACLTRGEIEDAGGELLGGSYIEERWQRADRGDRDARIELALAAGALRADPRAPDLVEPFLSDPDPGVASAAIRSAGLMGTERFHDPMIRCLRSPGTREAARDALAQQGASAVDRLADRLLDEAEHPLVRRHIPSVLARMPAQKAVDVMLYSVVAPETDQILDYRTLKALSQMRARYPELEFDPEMVLQSVEREVKAAARYDRARRCIRRLGAGGPTVDLLTAALGEAWSERREGAFRLLGLLYDDEEMYRCYLALSTGERLARGNALEWLEETVDRALFERLSPILGESPPETEAADMRAAIRPLLADGDPWIARLAVGAAAELKADWSEAALRGIIEESTSEELCELAGRLLEAGPIGDDAGRKGAMDLIEKVFLLQKIDLLQDARSGHLALLASIAEEVDVPAGTVLIRQDQPTDALYVVIEGSVELEGVADQVIKAGVGRAFGTWALIDEAPSLVTARVREPARLLRITRSDFYDLLADHSELALGLLQGLARRVRTLVA